MFLHRHHLLRSPIEQKLSRRGWQTYSVGNTLSPISIGQPPAPSAGSLVLSTRPRGRASKLTLHFSVATGTGAARSESRYTRKQDGKEEDGKPGRSTGLPSN